MGILKDLADVVFPPRCVACGTIIHKEGESFCMGCFSQIKFIKSPLCNLCGQPFFEAGESDHICGGCLESPPAFSEARALGQYETVLMDVIHRFKYGGKVSLGETLGEMMAGFTYWAFNLTDYSLIMPVPLHPKRLRQRGFNQAVILAKAISRRFSLPIDLLSLRRVAFTDPQVGLGKEMRENNIKGAFSVADKERIRDESIILVDDVYTTGSTVKECARMLMKNKAKRVAVLTLARTC